MQTRMFNLNKKYFSISERCGRTHQNKFCLRPLKGRLGPWELSIQTICDFLGVISQSCLKKILHSTQIQVFSFSFQIKMFLAKQWQTNFRRENPKYDDSSIVGKLLKKRFIDTSFSSEKTFLTGKPYIWILIKNFFPQKFLKMPYW